MKTKVPFTAAADSEEKKIRVLYLINGLGPGGAEMMLWRLLEHLDRRRYRPAVAVLLDQPGPLRARIEALGVPVHSVAVRSRFDLFAVLRLWRLLRVQAPHILHTQLFAADIAGRILGRMRRVPVVLSSIRNIYYGGRQRDLLLKWTDPLARRTTVVCHAAGRRLAEAGVIAPGRLVVIHNGVDPAAFPLAGRAAEKTLRREELGLPVSGFLWLAAGSLTPQKGYPDLLAALLQLPQTAPPWHLLVAGEGPLREELAARAEKEGLLNRVRFLGRSDRLPELMAASDALVLSSRWEGLPGVVLETMAAGLPVVATAVGGTPELVVEEESGFLVSPGDPSALAAAMGRLMSLEEPEREAMGRAGRRRVEKDFHVDKMVKAYMDLYEECLAEAGGGR